MLSQDNIGISLLALPGKLMYFNFLIQEEQPEEEPLGCTEDSSEVDCGIKSEAEDVDLVKSGDGRDTVPIKKVNFYFSELVPILKNKNVGPSPRTREGRGDVERKERGEPVA